MRFGGVGLGPAEARGGPLVTASLGVTWRTGEGHFYF